jgi:hypothetical protein
MPENEKLDLSAFGAFRYDPFADLDAAQDPHLAEYLVTPRAAAAALKPSAVAILAQPGGGKSALRIYIEQTQQDLSGITFTITYLTRADQSLDTPADHESNLRSALAYDSLIRVLTYPGRFLDMPQEIRCEMTCLIKWFLAYDLDFVLNSVLEHPKRAVEIVARYENRVHLVKSVIAPEPATVKEACLVMKDHCTARSSESKGAEMPLDAAMALARQAFSAREICILLDGVDNSTESKRDPARAAFWLLPLLERARVWEKNNVFLKAFLTTEMEAPLLALLADRGLSIPTPRMEWKEAHLLDVIRARVSAATKNRFNSLYAISALDLREIEMELVQMLPVTRRLPRDLVALTHLVLRSALQRPRSGQGPQIDRRDVVSAGKQFQQMRQLPG